MKKIICSPGDIVSELVGDSEASRYIIVAKGVSVDYRDVEYTVYKGYIIYVCEQWRELHKVGTTWLIDEQQIEAGALTLKKVFESNLSWEGYNVENEF